MATDIQQGVFYDTPVQGGEEKVTRQAGLPRSATIGIDPTPPPPIIQGDPLTVATRNAGPHVAGQFASDGTFHSDRRADDNTLYVDHALSDPEALPPGIARAALTPTDVPTPGRVTGFGDMTAVQQRAAIKAQAEALGFVVTDAPVEAKDSPTAFNVIASDEGAHDPRDRGDRGPQVLSALPVIEKKRIVPIVISASGAVQVADEGDKPAKAKAAPKIRRVVAKAASKGKGK